MSLAARRGELVEAMRARGTYRRWVLATALVGMFATTFPVTLLAVSLGVIAEDFGATEASMTWVIAGPLVASAAALPLLGKAGDIYGQRRVFLLGFTASTLVAGATSLAWNPLALIGLRTVTQVIGAATQPTSMALIMRAFPPNERVKAMGYWSLVSAGAPAVGLAVGGPLVDTVGWRALFVAQAVLAVVPVLVAAVVLEEVDRTLTRPRLDVAGAVSLAVTAFALMLGLNQSADWGWSHPVVVLALAATPVAAYVFVVVERRTASPLLPIEWLGRRDFVAPMVSEFFAGATYMGGFVMTPFLMRNVLGWSVSSVALLMLLRPLSYSLSAPVGGRLGMRWGERTLTIRGLVVLTASMIGFATGALVESAVVLAGALVFQGIGNGVARPGITATVANAVDEADLGIASASLRMAQLIGNGFGIAVLTAVYGGARSGDAFALAYTVAFGLGIVAVAAARQMSTASPVGQLAPT